LGFRHPVDRGDGLPPCSGSLSLQGEGARVTDLVVASIILGNAPNGAMAKGQNDLVYEHLAEALDRLPNGFPRTASNVEIRLLKKIFSPEEASLACQLGGSMESCEVISKRVGLSAELTEAMLTKMVEKGMLWCEEKEGKPLVRLAPFIVGVYEAQMENMDHEFAHLVEDYLANGGAAGIMKPQPAIHRVVPATKATKS